MTSEFLKKISDGDADYVRSVLDSEPKMSHYRSPISGESSLHRAIRARNPQIVELLLCSGATTNFRDSYQPYSALAVAILNGNMEIVELLLEYGAKLVTDEMSTIRSFVARNGNAEFVRLLDHIECEEPTPYRRA